MRGENITDLYLETADERRKLRASEKYHSINFFRLRMPFKMGLEFR